jgi:hypothetical protein
LSFRVSLPTLSKASSVSSPRNTNEYIRVFILCQVLTKALENRIEDCWVARFW